MIRNRTQLKRAIAVKREWDFATELARERVANLATECAAVKVTLQEREAQLREKEIECEVLQLNLENESIRCVELEEICGGLRKSNENGQKMTVDLLTSLEKSREAYEEALGKADMRSQESQRRMEKAEEAYHQLRDETTDKLKLRLEKCLNGFAMWGLQTVKWLKLDSLERRLMSAKTSGPAGHKQIVELVNTFLEELNEARQNVEVKIVNVLCKLGVDVSSDDTVTATSDGTAP
ncbi:hypothetical protein AXG93_4678s1000 [Marchantia polymorpha subsp. ruderalis]|uniref:Uncharacterized protein n=1 Tax=Marchantia polymorpha subsp. ruderalis TaxID=1480154 RepID=A0A176WL88_MARPO|nr:hypothetical protein AXG93_4678s1000 [Marchantia polymorpha subsp. ruderalis]